MSSPSNPSTVRVQRVEQGQFLGTIWSLLAIAIIMSILRLIARVRTFKKLLLDDYLVIAAVMFAISTAVIWQIYANSLFLVMEVSAGVKQPAADYATVLESYEKATLGVIFLYYSALWAIKMSFLILFRRLGTNVHHQKWFWWPVFLFTIATYLACIGDIYYPCLVSSMEYLVSHCTTPAAGRFNQITLKVNCAWDVVTDFLIMLLPFRLLYGVQMGLTKKLALAGIFSLVVITIIFSILRTALVGAPNSSLPDSSWLYLWSAIEVSIAIMIASIASFRNLFSRENSSKPHWTPPHPSNHFLRQNRRTPVNRLMALIDTIASSPDQQNTTLNVAITSTATESDMALYTTQRTDSDHPIIPPNLTQVKNEAATTDRYV